VTSFVGRRREILQVRRLLSQARLLTLSGPAGVGKTRLALQVAHRLQRTFPGGVWLVDLSAVQEPDLLAQAVADSLCIRDESARPTEAVLQEYLAGKSVLLLIDNCEHLLDACAELIGALLRGVPGLRILATSREPLRIIGEHVFDVRPLSIPDPEKGFPSGDLLGYEATALLLERAVAAVPGLVVDADNAEAMAAIAQRLDGLPLAIELAAVRLNALSPKQLLERLDDVFAVLGAGVRGGKPRQQTLRSVIDWSFNLCSPPEQALWARLSVFSGSFDLEAANAVCSTDGILGHSVLDLVTGLLDKSILIREEQPCGVRYRLLDTIRQYGRERLDESGQRVTLRRRHRDYYRRLARQMETEWYSPSQLTWFNRMTPEGPNVRVALDFCLTEPGQAQAGMEIATALCAYWHSHGYLHESCRWFERLLTQDQELTPTRAKALLIAAALMLDLNDVTGATPFLKEGRALASQFGDPVDQAFAARASGLAALLCGDVPGAATLFEEALARYQAADEVGGVLHVRFHLATAAMLLGDTDRAMTLAEQCVSLSESLGDHWLRSWMLWTQGVVAWRQGDTRWAAQLERDSIERKQLFNDRLGIGQCVDVLAWTAAADGQAQRAARLLGAVQVIWRETGASLYQHLTGFHQEVETQLRQALGPEVFEAASAEGSKLTYDQIVTYTLGKTPTTRTSPRQTEGDKNALELLTPREQEVAELVAEAMSNKQIAARLVISQRTAETHIEHILTKLGFTSRTQIAAWLLQQKASNAQDAAKT
jgi:non-specific serine/threonine protein kinase